MWQEPAVLRDKALRPASAVAVMTTFRPALLLLERALTLLGVVLLGWYGLEQLQIAYDQAAAGYELEEVRMHVAAANPASPVPHLTLATGTVVGRVEIPRVGVSALVREGDDVKTLRRAVGHIPGTALPGEVGNAALAGHRDTFFRGLRDLRTGDHILLTTPGGNARYVVKSMHVVDPSEVSVLAPTPKSTLTLVTCYPFNYIGAAPRRFIVRAEIAN
jgi:sortase A